MPQQEEDFIYLTTGEAAKSIGVPEHELRYWEKINLLIPMRIESGHRRYRKSDVRRGLLIKDLIKQGYSSKGIKTLLSKKSGKSSAIKTAGASDSIKRHAMLSDLKKEVLEILNMLKKMQ